MDEWIIVSTDRETGHANVTYRFEDFSLATTLFEVLKDSGYGQIFDVALYQRVDDKI